MPEWTEGVSRGYGAAILRDGEMVPIEEIVAILNQLHGELAHIRNGAFIVVPTSVFHAETMHLVAERYLKDNETI